MQIVEQRSASTFPADCGVEDLRRTVACAGRALCRAVVFIDVEGAERENMFVHLSVHD